MLMIDMRNSTARLSLGEIAAAGQRYGSDLAAFSNFMAGVRLKPDVLQDEAWQHFAGAAGEFAFFRALMHEQLPRIYDVRHLESLGGRFALRLDGMKEHGDFTVIAMNRRVLCLSGLPVDERDGTEIADASIRADVFLALWNDMLASLAEATLTQIGAARVAALRPKS